VNVGYLTDVSWRNDSISKGDDLMDIADTQGSDGYLKAHIKELLPSSGTIGKLASSRVIFLTRPISRMPPQHVRIVFHKTRSSCMENLRRVIVN